MLPKLMILFQLPVSIWTRWYTQRAFLVKDDCVLKGPLGRSLRFFARTAHSLTRSAALRFATLALLARSVHGLAHSLRSLPGGTVEIL